MVALIVSVLYHIGLTVQPGKITRIYLPGIISSDKLNEKKNNREADELSYDSLIIFNLFRTSTLSRRTRSIDI